VSDNKIKINKKNKRASQPDSEKYKQMILAFLRQSGEISMEKLASLHFLADFNSYYRNQKSMSGIEYRKVSRMCISEYFSKKLQKDKKSNTENVHHTN
jgi:hypothetical protein